MAAVVPERQGACTQGSAQHVLDRAWLFESTNPVEHRLAASYCRRCPIVSACVMAAHDLAAERSGSWKAGPDGTWGGLLWKNGQIVPVTHLPEAV